MQRMKELFDELGRLAARGDILTVQSAEQLFSKKLEGPAMAALVEHRIMDNKALRTELLNFVQRHELEALRKILAENRQALIGLQLVKGGPQASAQSGPGAGSSTVAGSHSSSFGAALPATAAPTYVPAAGASGTPVPPISREVTADDSLLMAVYTRMAVVEEAVAMQGEQGGALAARMGEVERGLHATTSKVRRCRGAFLICLGVVLYVP